jgi:hypothetical protein
VVSFIHRIQISTTYTRIMLIKTVITEIIGSRNLYMPLSKNHSEHTAFSPPREFVYA